MTSLRLGVRTILARYVIALAASLLLVWAVPEFLGDSGFVYVTAQRAPAAPKVNAYRFEELADGIHFAFGTGAMTVQSNSLVIINEDHVMLVDTSVTPAAARALIAQIEAELTDKPIKYVFNSHYHFDHAHGNQIFGDDVEIIAHEYVRQLHQSNVLDQRTNRSFTVGIPGQIESLTKQMSEAKDLVERGRLEADIRVRKAHWAALQEIKVKAPNVTYSDVMTIHKGGREVQLHFLGRGHTGGDTVIFLPEERIIFTGDFLVGRPGAGVLAYMGDAYVDEWPESLERLKRLEFDTMVPGHGEPFRERKQIADFQQFLRDLWAQVSRLRAQGFSVEEAIERVDLRHYEPQYGSRVFNVDPRAVMRIYELLQVRMPM